ncbi:hypothetical protein TCAL_16426 [Tigriopus californicus]|uniref:Uncharacterized protein n=1 Tax=Tigriopus californicus TaxID=6832 RepID=A0A553NYG3_TIGCA|nr:hypothetical protein TCAL_16426 [Tigriopus californicus]
MIGSRQEWCILINLVIPMLVNGSTLAGLFLLVGQDQLLAQQKYAICSPPHPERDPRDTPP